MDILSEHLKNAIDLDVTIKANEAGLMVRYLPSDDFRTLHYAFSKLNDGKEVSVEMNVSLKDTDFDKAFSIPDMVISQVLDDLNHPIPNERG